MCQLATWFSLTGSRSKCVLLCTGWAAQRDVKYVCGWLENENGENNVFGIFGNDFKIICGTQDRAK